MILPMHFQDVWGRNHQFKNNVKSNNNNTDNESLSASVGKLFCTTRI